MRYAQYLKLVPGMVALSLAACSGSGSSDQTSEVRIRCSGGEAFCISSCDLGCSQSGCSITEIAENQRLKFTFSSRVAAASVNFSSISIRTATGQSPNGDFLVNNNEVTFVPRVTTVNGVSTFGFQRNETYIITLAGGSTGAFGVRSVAGDMLQKEFTCTVVASRGIQDDDQQPPSVEMLAPVDLNAAPLDPTVVLRFSELIDTTPLRGTLTSASPVRFVLRRTSLVGTTLTCDRDGSGTVLEGIPRLSTERVGDHDVTVLTFKPSVQLPGESCVQVVVTADLRDLSGRQAVANQFQFFTQVGVSTPLTFSETFATPANLDPLVSGGTWNDGARPAQIGGDGRHGSFDPSLGGPSSSDYTWNTNQVIIPTSLSLTGQEYIVTDGKFYFTDFVLPTGVTLTFTGPVAPQIYVRGKVQIDGTIKLNAAAMTTFNARGTTAAGNFVLGQDGGAAGPGGGRGGNGGRECQGAGAIVVNGVFLTDGQPGEDVKLPAGHGYAANAVGTGGRGSGMNPPTGIAAPNTPAISTVYRGYFAPGGSGGGFQAAGGLPSVTPLVGMTIGAAPVAGTAFSLLPIPTVPQVPSNYSSLNHFVVGGSGGGGGGTHAYGTFTVTGDVYIAGAGGSGGGGAIAIRAGSDLVLGTGAGIQARGGAGVLIRGNDNVATNNTNWGVASPGGGGSGGSILLQADGNLNVVGQLDTTGGDGSRTGSIATAAINVTSAAGAGSPGFYRLETNRTLSFGSTTSVPTYNAANNAGPLNDSDSFSGCRSTWRSSGLIFPPTWQRYELDVDLDGNGTVDTTFTDSGVAGTTLANDINGPVVIQFQGAAMAQSSTTPVEGTVGPWRYGIGAGSVPGINLDSAIGFRFMMTFNRAGFPNAVVKALRVFART